MITRQNEQGNIRNKYRRLTAAVWRVHNQNTIGASNHQRAYGSNFMIIFDFFISRWKKTGRCQEVFFGSWGHALVTWPLPL